MVSNGLGAALLNGAEWFRGRPLVALSVGLAAFALALGIRFVLDDVLPSGFPYLTFFPAVLLTAFFCGAPAGILIAVLSVLSAWFWFIPPFDSFALDSQSTVAVLFFVAILSADILIIHVMHTALRQLSLAQSRTNDLLERQKALFEELQHRTANNMSFIGALISMHKRRVSSHPEAVIAFEDASARLQSMARIHRRLYDPTNIELPVDTYLADLLEDVFKSAGREDVAIAVRSSIGRLDVNRLIALSLVVSELATNAIKHAFPGPGGRFAVTLDQTGENYVMTASDNGPGFPEAFNPATSDRLGFRVLSSFARTLDGTLTFRSDGGAVTELVFPASDARQASQREIMSGPTGSPR